MTKLDTLAQERLRASSGDISRLGFAVAYFIDNGSPRPKDINRSFTDIAQKIADALLNAENPVIITGMHSNDLSLLHAAANIVLALSKKEKKPSLSIVFPESNSLGMGLMDGKPLEDLIGMIQKGNVETVIVLENNLYLRAEREKVNSVFNNCKDIVVIDNILNETAMNADILLPSGTFAESTGTISQ